MKNVMNKLAAWLKDEVTQAVIAAVFITALADAAGSAHRRIDRLEDELHGIVCSLPLRPVRNA